MVRRLGLAATVLGLVLLGLNLVGLAMPLRSPTITESYADFARDSTLTFDDALARLAALDGMDAEGMVTEATRVFHHGMAHIPGDDIVRDGLAHYRMRVPAWENFVLYALSYLKPDTYLDYEFCSYRKALERGTGRCGQQSMALVGFLSEQGIETGFIALGGHAVATAKVSDDRWFILDPDYGGVIPMSLGEVEADPRQIYRYYWGPAAKQRRLERAYAPDRNSIRYGGVEARYRRACPIERVAYALKWVLPVALLLAGGLVLLRRGPRTT